MRVLHFERMIPTSLGQHRLNWPVTPTGQWLCAAFRTVSQAVWPRGGHAVGLHRGHSPCLWNSTLRSHPPSLLDFKSQTLSPLNAIQRHSSNRPIEHGRPEGIQEDMQLQQAAAVALPALAAASLECTRSSTQQTYRSRGRGSPPVFLADVPGMAPLLRLAAGSTAPKSATAAPSQTPPEASGAPAEELIQFASRLDRTQQLKLSMELGPLLLAATSSSPTGSSSTQRLPILFDTETQGVGLAWHRVIDICLLDLVSGMEFSTLVFPGPRRPNWTIMPLKSTIVNGITKEMLLHSDVPSAEAVSLAIGLWLLQRCLAASPAGATPLLIAHIAIFDIKMTGVLLTLSNLQYGASWMQMCTCSLARTTFSHLPKHNLQVLVAEILRDSSQQQHRAAADVHLLARLLPHMLQEPSLQSAVQKLRRGAYDSSPSVSSAAKNEEQIHKALAEFFPANLSSLKAAQLEIRAAVLQAAGGTSSSSSEAATSSALPLPRAGAAAFPAAGSSQQVLGRTGGQASMQPSEQFASPAPLRPADGQPGKQAPSSQAADSVGRTSPPAIVYAARPRSPAASRPSAPVAHSNAPSVRSSLLPLASGAQQEGLLRALGPAGASISVQEPRQAGGSSAQPHPPAKAPLTLASRVNLPHPSLPGVSLISSSERQQAGGLVAGQPRDIGAGGPSAAQVSPLKAQVTTHEPSLRPGSTRRAKADSLLRHSAPDSMDVAAPSDGSMGVGYGSRGAASGGASSDLKAGSGGGSSSLPLAGGEDAVRDLTLGERLRLKKQAKDARAAEQAGAGQAGEGGVLGAGGGEAAVEGEALAGKRRVKATSKAAEQAEVAPDSRQAEVGAKGGEQEAVVAEKKKGRKKAVEEEAPAVRQKRARSTEGAATEKKKQGAAAKAVEQEAEAATTKKETRAKKVEQEQEQEAANVKKKTGAKKVEQEAEAATTKKTTRAKKVEQEQEAEAVTAKKSPRAKKVEQEQEQEAVTAKKKTGAKKVDQEAKAATTKKTTRAKKVEQKQEQEQETEAVTAKKKTRGRHKAAAEAVAGTSGTSTGAPSSMAASNLSRGSVSGRATQAQAQEELALAPAPAPPPEWQPCAVELSSKAASKWFPPAQLQKLRNAGYTSLLQVLMSYPKRHKVYLPAVDPTLARQDVAILGTTTKVGARMLNARCCMLSINVEHQLPPAAAAASQPGSTVVVNASIVAMGGRWSLKPMMELAQRFSKGSSVLLRGTLRGSGAPQVLTPEGQEAWSAFDCSGPELMQPEDFDPDANAPVPVYATRLELKTGDFEDRGKRRGVISRALGVLEGQADPRASDPLHELSGPARRLLDEVVLGAGDSAGEGAAAVRPLSWRQALAEVHRPSSMEALQLARRSLAATEMLMTQLQLLERRRQLLARRLPGRAAAACSAPELVRRAVAALPYELTPGQAVALREILADMAGTDAMSRLLQGDVGSGKTVVAMLAMLAAAGSGQQAAMLAPTEVLAEQHFAKLQELVAALPASKPFPLSCALLTSSTKNKKAALSAIAEGRHTLLVGTHSLLFVPRFSSLGLVVIDEQHKFGIRQKEAIARLQNLQQPHVLSMSATPIPRTIALVKYGDMTESKLRETPPNRKKVETRVLPDTAAARGEVFAAVRGELDAGGRAFIVYPLREPAADEEEEEGVAPAPKLDLRSAEKEFKALKKAKAFGKHGCALLHGGMSRDAKAAALESFRDGTTPALVCTVVIEVGVDVPDASILVVEHADRFGLAQLHQLRGRVGRGARQSHCFLLTPLTGEAVLQRLRFLETCHSGFDIAEQDLRFRGAGQVFGTGTRQSGDLDATDLCQEEIAKYPSIVEGARRVALLTMQGGAAPAGAEGTGQLGSKVPQQPLPDSLASAVAAFKVAVKRRPRQSSIFAEDEDEEGGEDVEETLGIAV